MDVVWHPAMERAEREFLTAIDQAGPYDIIMLIGLPRIGKSLVHRMVMRKIAGDPTKWGKGRLPMIFVFASATERSFFNSKDFFARALAEVRAPRMPWLRTDTDAEVDPYENVKREMEEARVEWAKLSGGKDRSEPVMRRMFEETARERGLKYFSIGQAGSMAFTQKGRDPSDHGYSLACLAEELNVVILMSGTPRVHKLWKGNAEVSGRVTKVFFQRYKPDSRPDMEHAVRLCKGLTAHLKFDPRAQPEKTMRLVYATTLISTGLVQEFYKRANNNRIADSADVITLNHLKQAVMTAEDLEALYEDKKLFDALTQPKKLVLPSMRNSRIREGRAN